MLASEHLTVTATADGLDAIHAALDRFWEALARAGGQQPDEMWRVQLVTAVAEIAGNIVRHAYPAGTEPGPLKMTLTAYADRIEAELRDQGVPFEETPGDETSPDADFGDLHDLAESGRGLMIAHAWLDRLEHSHTATDNRWLLVKRR